MADKTESSKDKSTESEAKDTSAIYVKISSDAREIIDNYKDQGKTISSIIEEAINIYNNYKNLAPDVVGIIDKYKSDFESETTLIEEAIRYLDKRENPERKDDLDLWCKAREELQMMLIGKTTFNQMLSAAETPEHSLDKPMKKNIALDVILWYMQKPINHLTIKEIIMAIKRMWIVANYFYFIEINEFKPDQFHLICKHHQNKRYSIYWLGYFKELFQSKDLSFQCTVEGQALDESLSMTIKKL